VTQRRVAVAIDGPAGAGKSTVSREVARRLGYVLLDTGALYRCVAWAARERGVAWDDEVGVGAVARELAERDAFAFGEVDGDTQRVAVDGHDVTRAIRAPEMSQGASRVSALPAVRAALLDVQRRAGERGGVVLEGRDIGTVVLPHAEAKFFLTASVDIRSRRRFDELEGRGVETTFEEVRRDVVERDHRDSTRPVAPLSQAPDAELVDSSDLGIEEVVSRIVSRVEAIATERSGS
jgi:cytidylate kinase